MRALSAALTAALVALPGPLATADPGRGAGGSALPPPPYVDHTQWTQWSGMPRLRVFPTPAARVTSLRPGTADAADEAWSELLALAPNAGTPGMRAQFVCHWQFAERALPGKVSWNLEPWRPVVGYDDMVASGCNPGGAEDVS
ncbi:DUF2599 domain-containing protein [Mycobacterium sp. HUMS_1102779]|uniref:DUF2599 domain-containing protein n=1 Tax=Mycobacterium sp. HUMS_1102779 TaxID=3383487 RepID=UPI00389A4864